MLDHIIQCSCLTDKYRSGKPMPARYWRAYMKKFLHSQRMGVWRITFADNAHECSFITSFNRIDFFKVHYHCMDFLMSSGQGTCRICEFKLLKLEGDFKIEAEGILAFR